MTILVQDSFNRANNATSIGNADTGQTWVVTGSPLGILNNTVYTTTNADKIALIDSLYSDVSVQLTHTVWQAYSSPRWRQTDDNNNFRIDTNTVYKKVGGVSTALGTISPTLKNGDIIKITVSGNTHTIFVNGVQKVTFTESFNQTATKHGFQIYASSARLDDFLVETLTTVTVEALAGTSTETSTASGDIKRQRSLLGNSSEASTSSATTLTLSKGMQLSGASSEASTASANLKVAKKVTGASTESSTANANIKVAKKVTGASTEASTASTTVLKALNKLAGTSTEASTASAPQLKAVNSLSGSSSEASTASAPHLKAVNKLEGTSTEASTASASLTISASGRMEGQSTSGSNVTGSLKVSRKLSASAVVQPGTQGNMSLRRRVGGTSSASATTQANVKRSRSATATSVSNATTSSVPLKRKRRIYGVSTEAGTAQTNRMKTAKRLTASEGVSSTAQGRMATIIVLRLDPSISNVYAQGRIGTALSNLITYEKVYGTWTIEERLSGSRNVEERLSGSRNVEERVKGRL